MTAGQIEGLTEEKVATIGKKLMAKKPGMPSLPEIMSGIIDEGIHPFAISEDQMRIEIAEAELKRKNKTP